MKRESLFSKSIVLFLVAAAVLTGCGGDDKDDGATCGAGTIFSEELDACVPDGSNICSGNTKFDPEMKKCVVDPSLCAEGTVLVGDACVPFDDTLMGDVSEGTEPNDTLYDGTPATITLGDADESVTFKGCVTAVDFDEDGVADADVDQFAIQVSEPTLIEVTVDGVGGLAGAFMVEAADEKLVADGWSRFGFNVSADISRRQIFLPKAGGYFLGVSDYRSLTGGTATGTDKTCYFGSVKTLSLPAAGAFVLGTPTSARFGDPEFYAGEADEGDVFDILVAADAETAAGVQISPAFVALKDGQYYTSASADAGDPAQGSLYGLHDGQSVTVVVDYQYSLAIEESVDAVLLVAEFPVEELGTDDSLDLTHDELNPFFGYFFEGAQGDVARLSFESPDEDVIAVVLDPDGNQVATLCGEACDGGSAWFQLAQDGNYYFLFRAVTEDIEDGAEFSLDVTRASVTPTDVVLGASNAVGLTDEDRAFFVLDVSGTDWLSFETTTLLNAANVAVEFYPLGEIGALGTDLPLAFSYLASADVAPGRVTKNENDVWLVAVRDGGAWDGDESFSFKVAERAFTDLGSLSQASPLAAAAHATPANDSKYFLASASPGSKFAITVNPDATLDVGLLAYNADGTSLGDVDEGDDDANETLEVTVGSSGVVGIEVYGGGEAGNFTIAIGVTDPAYDPAVAGNLAFTDICASGVKVIDQSDVDMSEPVMLDSFAFDFFREEMTAMRISTDGWITFDSSYSGPGYEDTPAAFPNTAADYHGVISAAFMYISAANVCVKKTATEVTVQWTGEAPASIFGPYYPAAMQVVLHVNGDIDMIYGAANEATPALIGMESLSGEEFVNYGGSPAAASSLTFTANP
jgi:hypothetical protein